ncbi:MAG: sigma-70 family RNA polymerase sigma factor [Ilumatobacteraceae bacterium]
MNNDQERQLKRIIETHVRAVSWTLTRSERDQVTREELLADVFEVAYRHLDELASLSDDTVRSWLIRTAEFLAANEARRGARRRQLLERLAAQPVESEMPSAEDLVVDDDVRRQQDRQIRAAYEQLPIDDQVLLARAAAGWTGPELATELGVTAVAVRSRLMRARAAFRERFQVEPPAVDDGTASR